MGFRPIHWISDLDLFLLPVGMIFILKPKNLKLHFQITVQISVFSPQFFFSMKITYAHTLQKLGKAKTK